MRGVSNICGSLLRPDVVCWRIGFMRGESWIDTGKAKQLVMENLRIKTMHG